MIKLINSDELEIRLNGTVKSSFDMNFVLMVSTIASLVGLVIYFALGLLMTLIFLVVVGVFSLMYLKSQQKTQPKLINNGLLRVTKGTVIHEYAGKQITYESHGNDCQIDTHNDAIALTLSTSHLDNTGNVQISGFESQKEVEMVQAFLQGKSVKVRHKSIKMQSN